jgi:hypothetical protein
MNKLPTREVINLIAAIEDSNLLKWKHQSNPNSPWCKWSPLRSCRWW